MTLPLADMAVSKQFLLRELRQQFHFPRNPCLYKRKQKEEAVDSARVFNPVLRIAGQKFPLYFEEYLEFFAAF